MTNTTNQTDSSATTDIAAIVNRFLGWRLPKDFYPDCGITFKHNEAWGGYPNNWPVGTNLFTADQAKEMFEHCLRDVARPTDDDLWEQTMRDRDTNAEWADKLANAIAEYFGVEIGEHSNINCPWAEALEVIECTIPAPQAATPLPGELDERAEEKSLADYQPGQWWLGELENLWGHHGEVSADTRRAAKVACDFAKLVFVQQAAPGAPPDERRNIAEVQRTSDMGLSIRFMSARACSAFERYLTSTVAAPEAPASKQQDEVEQRTEKIRLAHANPTDRSRTHLIRDVAHLLAHIALLKHPAATTASASGDPLLGLIWRINDAVLKALPRHPDPGVMRARHTKCPMEVLVNVESLVSYFKEAVRRASAPSREAAPMPKKWHERTETMDDRSCMLAMKAEIADLSAALARQGAQPDGDLPQTLVYDPKA